MKPGMTDGIALCIHIVEKIVLAEQSMLVLLFFYDIGHAKKYHWIMPGSNFPNHLVPKREKIR